MWLSPLHAKKTVQYLWAKDKGYLRFQIKSVIPVGNVPCVSLIRVEKLNLAFLSEILLSLRNGTSTSPLSYYLFSSGKECEAENSRSWGSFFSNGE